MNKRRATFASIVVTLAIVTAIVIGWPGIPSPLKSAGQPDELAGFQRQTAALVSDPRRARSNPPRVRRDPALRLDPADADYINGIVIARHLDELLERAGKDPAFATSLSSALNECAWADRSYRSLSENVKTMSGERAEAALMHADRRFAKCEGLTDGEMEKRIQLVTNAALAGSFDAQFLYTEIVSRAISTGYAARTPNAMDEIRVNAEAFTAAAAQTGDPEALYRAAGFYRQGLFVPKNPVLAHQYLTRFLIAMPPNPQLAASIRSTLVRLEAEMTPEQREARSRQLIGVQHVP